MPPWQHDLGDDGGAIGGCGTCRLAPERAADHEAAAARGGGDGDLCREVVERAAARQDRPRHRAAIADRTALLDPRVAVRFDRRVDRERQLQQVGAERREAPGGAEHHGGAVAWIGQAEEQRFEHDRDADAPTLGEHLGGDVLLMLGEG